VTPRLTLQDLRSRGLLAKLADAFASRNEADELLDAIRFPSPRRPVFSNANSVLDFWTDVCRDVARGITAGGLEALLAAAASLRPDAGPFTDASPPVAASPGPSARPNKLLFLASNPPDLGAVRSGREWELIHACLSAPGLPTPIEPLPPRFAVGPEALVDAVTSLGATVLHFSGHGQAGRLVLEDDRGNPVTLLLERLAQVLKFMPAGGRPRLIFLNACFVGAWADRLCESVEAVIGSGHAIPDDLALAFVRRFYHALTGRPDVSVAAAVGLARVEMQILADQNPALAGMGVAPADYLRAVAAPGVDLNDLVLGRPSRAARP
jgi:hypothetical protein